MLPNYKWTKVCEYLIVSPCCSHERKLWMALTFPRTDCKDRVHVIVRGLDDKTKVYFHIPK